MTAVAPARGTGVVDATTPAVPARAAAVLAVLVALVGAVLGPTGGLQGLLGPDAVTVAAGIVEQQLGTDWVPVAAGDPVADGTLLRAPSGIATLGVPGGTADLAEGTQVRVDDGLRVVAGSVVVASPRLVVGDGAASAQGPGTYRWDGSGRVGAYDGSVVVTDATGRQTLVRTLQQARVRDAVVTESPRPYVYADADPFDRQHLAAALRVDDYVAALRGGLTADYGTAPQPAAFYTDFDGLDGALVAALGDVGFDRDGDRFGPPADVLVAAVVTDALVTDAGLAPQAAADEVRELRLAGAAWGLVAQARDLDAGNVRAAAERALARRQQAEDAGTAVPALPGTDAAVAPAPDAPAAPPAPTGGSDTGTEDPGGSTDDDGGTSTPPSTPPQEDDPGTLGAIVDETGVGDVLPDELGGLVDEVVDAGDDLLDETVPTGADDPVGGLLDTTGEVVESTVGSLLGH